MTPDRVFVTAPAKVNLYLAVGAVRPDGFHDVTTILQALEFGDELIVDTSDRLTLSSNVDLGIPAEDNLAYRAAVAMGEAFRRAPSVAITLTKAVPAGAGLGGGSSDAAAVIAALAALWSVPVDSDVLARVAASLGSDVPFFLVGGTALFEGRGDRFVRSIAAPVFDVALIKPPESVPTGAAYEAFDRLESGGVPGARHVADACRSGDVSAVAATLYNNMTEASAGLVGSVGDALAWVKRSEGVLGAAMCGSGSAVFAVCADHEVAARTAQQASDRGWWSRATRTSSRGVEVRGTEESV